MTHGDPSQEFLTRGSALSGNLGNHRFCSCNELPRLQLGSWLEGFCVQSYPCLTTVPSWQEEQVCPYTRATIVKGYPSPKAMVVLCVHSSSLALKSCLCWDIKGPHSVAPVLWPYGVVCSQTSSSLHGTQMASSPQNQLHYAQEPFWKNCVLWDKMVQVTVWAIKENSLCSRRDNLRCCVLSCFLLNQLGGFIRPSVCFSSVNKCSHLLI